MENPLQLEECIICFEETDNFTFFPCTHKVCPICFPKLDRCPLCQSNNIRIRQINTRERDDFKIWVFIIIVIIFLIWYFYAHDNLQI